MQKRKLGWIPDNKDYRDYIFKVHYTIKVPPVIDLRSYCSPVENQEDIGSCTAQALVGNLEILEVKNKTNFYDISRLFIYYNERKIEGTINEDSGAMIRDGIKTLAKDGYCSEVLCPYITSKFTEKPSKKAYKEAQEHKIKEYSRILNINDMLQCLARGYPFVFGITLYNSFMSEKVAKTGIVEMPVQNDSSIGGHAVCAVGYDLKTKRFLVRNSWGKEWGMEGYFTLPFEYMQKLASDCWTIRRK